MSQIASQLKWECPPLPFTISYAKKEEIHDLQNITSPPPVI
jgi:hypothetical protein